MAGYSGTPLLGKLGIKEGNRAGLKLALRKEHRNSLSHGLNRN
jgi:hypothetical protein